MTLKEKAIVETYTGVCMLVGDDRVEVYKYMAEIMGRPVFSHELADQKVVEELKERSKHDFVSICSKKEADDRLKAMKPVLKEMEPMSFVDYENGTGECILNKYIYFECPSCGGFVGEKYPYMNRAQHKCQYCPKCGKAIDWSGEDEQKLKFCPDLTQIIWEKAMMVGNGDYQRIQLNKYIKDQCVAYCKEDGKCHKYMNEVEND